MILTGLIALSKLLHLHNKIRTFTSGITGAYDPSTVMYYVWALPYLFIVGYIFIKLGASVNSVAREIRKPLSVAAMLFFTGAIALELAGLAYARTHEGSPDIYHSLIKTLEELLQLLGSIALISILGAQMSAQQQACERSA